MLSVLLTSTAGLAFNAIAGETTSGVRADEDMRLQSILLQRDVSLLEAEGETLDERDIAVFVVLDADAGLSVQRIELRLDDSKPVTHAYTEIESAALRRGGAHRMVIEALSPGKHELSAAVSGSDERGNRVDREVMISITPGTRPSLVQLRINGPADLRMTQME